MRMKSAQQSRCFFFQQLALRRIEVKKARKIKHFRVSRLCVRGRIHAFVYAFNRTHTYFGQIL